MMLPLVLSIVVSYLLGSINFSLMAAYFKDGKDLRNYGSGNAGATNLLRNYGWKLCIVGFLGDALKGIFAVEISRIILRLMIEEPLVSELFGKFKYVFAAAAVIGHIYPIYFKFRGGKGVATALLLGFYLDWRVGSVILLVCFPILLYTRYVSLAVLIGLSIYPLCTYLASGENRYSVLFAFGLFFLMTFKHLSNLKRILNNSENKVSFGKNEKDKT